MICLFICIISFQITSLITGDPILWLIHYLLHTALWESFLVCDVQMYVGDKELKMNGTLWGLGPTFWFTLLVFTDIMVIFLLILRSYQMLECLPKDCNVFSSKQSD